MTNTTVNNGDTYGVVRAKINQANAVRRYIEYGALDRGVNTPPGSPADGDVYIIGSAPTGGWAGQANKIAVRHLGAWVFEPSVDASGASVAIGAAHEGLTVYVRDEDQPYVWSGSAWVLAINPVAAPWPSSTARPLVQILRDDVPPSIMDYGAVGDGVTDDRPALQAALSQNRGVYIPFCRPDGTEAVWRINGEVTVGADRAIIGDPRRPMIRQAAASRLFVLDGSRITIRNLLIDQVGQTSTAHATFHANTAVRSEIKTIRMSNIRCGHTRTEAGLATLAGFRTFDDDASTGQLIDWQVQDVVIWGAKDAAIYLRDAWAAIFLDKIVVDFTRQGAAPSYPGIDIDGGEGVNLSFCNVQGLGTSGAGNAFGHGYSIANGAAVDLQDCRADTVGGLGFRLVNLVGSRLRGLVGSLCGEGQIVADNCVGLGMDEIYAGGRSGLGWAPAGKHGLRIINCSRARVTGLRAVNNTGSGTVLTDASGCQISNFDFASNGAYGIDETGASNFNVISTGLFAFNGTSNGRTVGTGTARANVIYNSGAYVNSAVGAGTW